MAKESFIFYKSFLDALEELPDDLRLKLYDAIAKYALKSEEIELSGIAKAVFTLVKPQINANHQKYENGCKGAEFGKLGGRPKKPQENPKQTPRKPQANPKQTPNENENVNVNENDIITPIIPYEGKGDGLREKFFKTYPSFKGEKRCDDSGVDYSVLLEEFSKSRVLRGMYSFAKVCGMYDAIARGDFRDKETTASLPSSADGFEARAKRERWYSARRAKAEAEAEKVYKQFMQDETFAKIDKRLRTIGIDQAKAEVKGDKVKASKLEQERGRLELQKRGIIERNGMTEEDLKPKWHCKKCQDTGFVDGIPCGCYEE
jgi:hypothetical protein